MESFEYITRGELYDDMGAALPSTAEDGYDINGWPACRVLGVIIDDRVISFCKIIK